MTEQEHREPAPTPKNKPVIVYIMVLFIAAFLLMALSFLMHQRSNTEVMGELQNSVSSLQEIQALQNQVIGLQQTLEETEDALEEAQKESAAQQKELEEARESAGAYERKADALYYLYALQQQYLLQDYEGCRSTIQAMEDKHLAEELSDSEGAVEVNNPASRYQELKAAVEARGTP